MLKKSLLNSLVLAKRSKKKFLSVIRIKKIHNFSDVDEMDEEELMRRAQELSLQENPMKPEEDKSMKEDNRD